MESLCVQQVRRLALTRSGLFKPEWAGFPALRRGCDPHAIGHAMVETLGYLQLDTISIAGARSHSLVLLSRLPGLPPHVGEQLLRADGPLFEYWGHEASWIPTALYPAFEFRRQRYRTHPWSRGILADHAKTKRELLRRIEADGPLRSAEMEGKGGSGWWDFKLTKRVATAMWSTGELAIRERRNFHRLYDLPERVIPEVIRATTWTTAQALRELLLRAVAGHGWASTTTLAATWRLRNLGPPIKRALAELVETGQLVPCSLDVGSGKTQAGWVRPCDLELVTRLRRARPRRDQGVLLSPFDPVLWDRKRVATLFDFDQVLEVFKPAAQRVYGYFCMPVLAGETLIARVDLKAERKQGRLDIRSLRYESDRPTNEEQQAVSVALTRYADALELALPPTRPRRRARSDAR